MNEQTLLLVVNMLDYGDEDPEFDAVVDRIDTLINVFQEAQHLVAFATMRDSGDGLKLVRSLRRYATTQFELHGLSAFFNSAFSRFIDEQHIKKVYVCGMGMHDCVLKAVLDTKDWHWTMQSPVLIQDACYNEPAWRHLGQAVLSILSVHDVEMSDTASVVADLTQQVAWTRRIEALSAGSQPAQEGVSQ